MLPLFLALLLPLTPAHAAGPYSLFHPVPKAELRELTTDRPDRTESPFTVDAGHFQLETDVAAYTRDRAVEGGAATVKETWNVNNMNLKLGLLDNLDLQAVLPSYVRERTSGAGGGVQDGVGDLTVRLKWNLFGNAGGDIAMGLLPFVKLPTGQRALGNGKVEGGLIVPVTLKLPAGFGLGLMAEVDRNKNENGDGFHQEFISSFSLSHPIAGELEGYVEIFSQASAEPGADWQATFDTGLTLGLGENMQVDAGLTSGSPRPRTT